MDRRGSRSAVATGLGCLVAALACVAAPVAAAAAFLIFIPSLLIFIIFQKWFTRGITAGALKF